MSHTHIPFPGLVGTQAVRVREGKGRWVGKYAFDLALGARSLCWGVSVAGDVLRGRGVSSTHFCSRLSRNASRKGPRRGGARNWEMYLTLLSTPHSDCLGTSICWHHAFDPAFEARFGSSRYVCCSRGCARASFIRCSNHASCHLPNPPLGLTTLQAARVREEKARGVGKSIWPPFRPMLHKECESTVK